MPSRTTTPPFSKKDVLSRLNNADDDPHRARHLYPRIYQEVALYRQTSDGPNVVARIIVAVSNYAADQEDTKFGMLAWHQVRRYAEALIDDDQQLQAAIAYMDGAGICTN